LKSKLFSAQTSSAKVKCEVLRPDDLGPKYNKAHAQILQDTNDMINTEEFMRSELKQRNPHDPRGNKLVKRYNPIFIEVNNRAFNELQKLEKKTFKTPGEKQLIKEYRVLQEQAQKRVTYWQPKN
jgi:hypothetical protein